ncbi:MAG: hypothetical protein N3A65_01635 [candidate division WOR-3 bacterium]|nr:hypothetical protein [candidate division WOR-3 bacterium]
MISYEIQVPFDSSAKIYEIDSAQAQLIDFFKNYPALHKALLFLQPDSSYVIEIYSQRDGQLVKQRLSITPEEISHLKQALASIKIEEKPKIVLERSGYREFSGSSFVFC